jgi:CrcB protein
VARKASIEVTNLSVILVLLAGGLGALVRYLTAFLWPGRATGIPWGIVAVNVGGSALVGVVAGLLGAQVLPASTALLITVGFCGGLTTMSTLAVDTATRWNNGRPGVAAMNVLVTVTASLIAVSAGYIIAGGPAN